MYKTDKNPPFELLANASTRVYDPPMRRKEMKAPVRNNSIGLAQSGNLGTSKKSRGMKTLLFLLLFVAMMTTVVADKAPGKQQRSIRREFSNAVPGRTSRRFEREKKINRGFDWIIQGVNILDQVDSFISDRTKNIVRKLHAVYSEGDTAANKNYDRKSKKNS